MLRPILLMAVKSITVVAISGGVLMEVGRYMHPDMSSRSTDELRWEVIALGRDNANESILVGGLALERQHAIATEIARRTLVETNDMAADASEIENGNEETLCLTP